MGALGLLGLWLPLCVAEQLCEREHRNATLNSAPLLLQRPGAHVSSKARSHEPYEPPGLHELHELHELHSERELSDLAIFVTETRSLMRTVMERSISLEQFGPAGVHKFFNAALAFDWCLFLVAACAAVLWRRAAPSPYASLVGWLALAGLYVLVIFARMGSHHGSNWLAGYFLELVFLVENVFAFNAIAEAFLISGPQVLPCLVVVAWGQICFDAIFFMGLAQWLRSWMLLPYALGLWLLGLGVSVLCHSEPAECLEGSPRSEEAQSPAADMLRSVVGNRLDMDGHSNAGQRGFLVLREKDLKVPIVHVVTCMLLLADFLLDIDVVLTKIQEIPNTYIGFSSSALAAFMIPELFTFSQDMLSCFPLLHYGIGVVLCFFGLQMLLQAFVELEPLISCAVVVLILSGCVVASAVQDHWRCPERTPQS